MKLNLLAVGVHPDDVELGCAGVLINEIRAGKTAAILDLPTSPSYVETHRSKA